MNDAGEIVGMVDVLKLTYATLEQINTMSSGDSEGPAWNKFWLSLDHETESMLSGDGSHHHTHPTRSLMSPDITRSERLPTDSVAPGDSASHTGADSPEPSLVAATSELPPSEIPFPFKFKAPSGRVHRLQVTAARGIAEFVANVTSKLGSEVEGIGGAPVVEDGKVGLSGYALSYLDDEGDSVSITTDHDLLEAILLARQRGSDKVDLFVHDPEKPPTAPASTPLPEPIVVATPPASSVVRERRRALESDEDDEDEEEDESRVRRARKTRTAPPPAEQVIVGVPNELLLPGAIVTLAVVIIGVFAISRASSR
jgi:hypothetical protein